MITIPKGHRSFGDEQIANAKAKAKELGEINNSITKGIGNTAGYLAEEILAHYFEMELISCNSGKAKYNNDLKKNDIKFESKTKRRGVVPTLNYEATIAETSLHQKVQYYIFSSIKFEGYEINKYNQRREYKKPLSFTIIGFISKEDFLNKARFLKKGEVDKSNNYKVHQNQYNIKHKELINAKELFNLLQLPNKINDEFSL